MTAKKLLAIGIYAGICVGLPLGMMIAIYVISGWQTLLHVSVAFLVIVLLGAALAWAKITLGIEK